MVHPQRANGPYSIQITLGKPTLSRSFPWRFCDTPPPAAAAGSVIRRHAGHKRGKNPSAMRCSPGASWMISPSAVSLINRSSRSWRKVRDRVSLVKLR